MKKILTDFINPPIPIRIFDWIACQEGDEEDPNRYGWGETKQEAIEDCLKNCEEN